MPSTEAYQSDHFRVVIRECYDCGTNIPQRQWKKGPAAKDRGLMIRCAECTSKRFHERALFRWRHHRNG